MKTDSLVGTNINLTVSEPEEFYFENGEGPFKGTIISVQKGLLAIRLDKALTYGTKKIMFMVASVRHANASNEDLLNKGSVFVNLVPVFSEQQGDQKSESWIFDTVKRWRGGHFIGNLHKR